MQRALYRLEDRLFYRGATMPGGLQARLWLVFSRVIGSDTALDVAIITPPEARDPALMRKLDAVAGRVLGK